MNPTPTAITDTPTNIDAPPAYWSGVFAMTLCVFALIASEFLPVSILTPLAVDLQVSEGLVGQGIAISGAFAVVTSLLITRLAGDMNRRNLLLGLTALMGVSGAVIALAPNYAIYMVGRALIGVVVGGFWSMSAATAMRLVPRADVPRALAIFNSGNALATVIAAPLGAWLGAIIGWRGAFFCLVPIALITFIWQWISLPSMPVESKNQDSHGLFNLLSQRVEPEEHLELAGLSDSDWRERIGNAVPKPAAKAIGSVLGETILLARSGETFVLSATPLWVRPIAIAITLSREENQWMM